MQISHDKLSFRTKFSYGLGTLAFGIKDHGFNVLLMLYYNQVIGLPAASVGLMIMLAMIVDAVADPLIGHLSDRTRTRWGRRHPFMYGSAIPVAVAYFLLWLPPHGSQALQLTYLLILSVAVRVAISCYEIPSSALMSEFSSDYEERTSLSTYRTVFFALGTVIMSLLVFKVLLLPTAEQPVGQLNAAGYARYATVSAVLMAFAILISALGTHKRIPTLSKPLPVSEHSGLFGGLRALLTDRPYVSVLLCGFMFAVAAGLAATLGVYISTYFWRLGAADLGTIGASAGGGLILALAILQFTRRYSKKHIAVSLFSVALVAIVLPVALGLPGWMPRDPGRLVPILIASTLVTTAAVLAAAVVSLSMVADVADHLDLKTGRRMEGLMFAASVMVNKAVSGVGVFLSGVVLSAIHFPEKADPATVDPAIVNEMTLVAAVCMGVFATLAILILQFYPITRESHQRTIEALKLRRAPA
ncbi:MFS transporter [Solimonas terrae]|uniref:MFS transporter n=1 Tax=Solimonas terrae TaxID=1396819 RepID=A0A6M2BM73_9GAMM|nr:MFS transporter [Solimonas terrae]NGY03255.1 MFS transporter [Solimonas terrae]